MDSSNAENEKLRQVTRAVVRRLEKAAQFCGDPQHPLWDGGRTSAEARRRIDGLLDILDPFRPELEDASDEDWDRVYKLDPIDAFVSDFEELAQTQRDEALQALAESRARFADSEARRAELEAVIEKVREHANGSANIGQPAPYDGFEEGLDHGAAIEAEAILRIVAAALSVVLEDRDRENRAIGFEAAVSASRYSYENLDWWINPYRGDNQ